MGNDEDLTLLKNKGMPLKGSLQKKSPTLISGMLRWALPSKIWSKYLEGNLVLITYPINNRKAMTANHP